MVADRGPFGVRDVARRAGGQGMMERLQALRSQPLPLGGLLAAALDLEYGPGLDAVDHHESPWVLEKLPQS
ncbi:MAG: hypothetical protein CME06_13745 [Gemmatimonadetes bacterium]|nr:hypothetical protein [Gemmatimonadota bacterium]